jgi:DNA-binding MarR family transcriptional regulator
MDTPLFLDTHYQSTDGIDHVFARARKQLTKSLDATMAEHGITHAQGRILALLSTERYATAADLARELEIDAASMTRMIDRLEKRKLILRLLRGEDRRMINLRLTPGGRVLAEKLPAIHAAVMNRSFAGFGAEDVEHLRNLLQRLLANCVAHP